jgi:hypothetical protein
LDPSPTTNLDFPPHGLLYRHPSTNQDEKSSNRLAPSFCCCFLKKFYLKNIKITFFYFLKNNFDINKSK